MKAFILTFDYNVLTRQTMLNFLDMQPAIRNWRATTGAILIASDLDVSGLANLIMQKFPGKFFIVAELDEMRTQGWNDQETWDFINSPKPWPGR